MAWAWVGMGFYNDAGGVWAAGFANLREPRPGHIAFISHAGSVFGAFAHNDPRFRFNLVVSAGQELVTTAAEYLDYALEQVSTRVVGLFLETVRAPRQFAAALAKAAERDIPVVVLKAGRTEASAALALSHSGAIAGNDAAYEALFDRHGVTRVDTLDELAATLLLFAQGRRAASGGLAVIQDTKYKYVHFDALPPLFFDLEADPDQFHNRACDPAYAPRVLEYAQKLTLQPAQFKSRRTRQGPSIWQTMMGLRSPRELISSRLIIGTNSRATSILDMRAIPITATHLMPTARPIWRIMATFLIRPDTACSGSHTLWVPVGTPL